MTALQVVALVLGILILTALVVIPIARRARGVQAGLDEELGDTATRKATVRGLGLESRGKGQVRGNGSLVLGPGELRFAQWVPHRETRIPLDAVTVVETRRVWLGKTVGSKLPVRALADAGGRGGRDGLGGARPRRLARGARRAARRA